MKSISLKNLAAAVLALVAIGFSTNAPAAPSITGSIQFVGGATLNGLLDTATAFASIFGPGGTGNPLVSSLGKAGTYAIVPTGTEASFSLLTFNPAPVSPFTLWSFSLGGTAFSFDITSLTIASQTSSFLDLEGSGIAHITGYADSIGTWSITDTGTGDPVLTFGAQTVIVPEPSTVALLLFGAAGLVVFRASVKPKTART